jgi:hypothetical protein
MTAFKAGDRVVDKDGRRGTVVVWDADPFGFIAKGGMVPVHFDDAPDDESSLQHTEEITMTHEDFTLCRSDQGDGGWSLHAPGATDEEIACGDKPALASGPSEFDSRNGWLRPNLLDYLDAELAFAKLVADSV